MKSNGIFKNFNINKIIKSESDKFIFLLRDMNNSASRAYINSIYCIIIEDKNKYITVAEIKDPDETGLFIRYRYAIHKFENTNNRYFPTYSVIINKRELNILEIKYKFRNL